MTLKNNVGMSSPAGSSSRWLVTYRGKDGTPQVIEVGASDRADLFRQLAAKGISALKVEIATGKSYSKQKTGRRKPRTSSSGLFKGVIATSIIVVGAFAAWMVLMPDGEGTENEKQGTGKAEKATIAEVMPSPAPVKVEEPVMDPEPAKPEPPPFVKRPGALQLPNGQVITFRPPPPGQEKTVWVHGRKYIADSEGNFYDASPIPTFDNRFENTMEAMSALGGGVLPAAALSIPKDDIIKYLASPIIINDDDPEDVVEKKIATAEMKELLKDYIKEGGNWEDFVMELNNIRRDERMLQGQAISEIAKMLREGDEEGAQEYRAKVDEFMKSKGYRGLKVPEKWGLADPPVASEDAE